MASLAWPDLWPDLSGLGSTEKNGSYARAALLKVNAEMFVAAPARDRETIETFETLALGFLPMVDDASLIDIANILAPCEDTPASVLDYLARHSPRTRDILLGHATQLPSPFNAKLLGTPEGRLQLASRPAVDARTVERLLVLRESEVEDALATNPEFAPTELAFEEIVRRAQDRPSLAGKLLERTDLTIADEAALYLAAPPERRERIRDRLAASVAFQRATLSFKLTEQDIGSLLAAAMHGDERQLEALLTAAFGFPATADWRVLQIGRHPLLALALKALGLAEKEATRIFLNLHPALSHSLATIKGLVRVVRDIPSPVALALVEAILGVQALSGRSMRHHAPMEGDSFERSAASAPGRRVQVPDGPADSR
jgi:hypothetical protein